MSSPADRIPAGSPVAGGVRMLASDLDGTLLRSDNTVSQATRDALAAAESAGLVVAFVTGRPPRWLHRGEDRQNLFRGEVSYESEQVG